MTVISGAPHELGESGMGDLGGARTIAEPAVPGPAAGAALIGVRVPASAACRASRPGKAVPDQTGAAASPVFSTVRGRRALAHGITAG
jgi:hypothetical protein